jgi:hypothetical protein
MAINWMLENCCGEKEEIVFLVCYAFYTVLTFTFMEYSVSNFSNSCIYAVVSAASWSLRMYPSDLLKIFLSVSSFPD